MSEQRIIHLRQMGRRDFKEGRPMVIPDYLNYLKDQDERDAYCAAYCAGYLGEKERMEKDQKR
jgi:hypothetical protein